MAKHRKVSTAEKDAELLATGESRPLCECHGEVMRWCANDRLVAGGRWCCPVGKHRKVSTAEKSAELLAAGESPPLCECHGEAMKWFADAECLAGGRWACSVLSGVSSALYRGRWPYGSCETATQKCVPRLSDVEAWALADRCEHVCPIGGVWLEPECNVAQLDHDHVDGDKGPARAYVLGRINSSMGLMGESPAELRAAGWEAAARYKQTGEPQWHQGRLFA